MAQCDRSQMSVHLKSLYIFPRIGPQYTKSDPAFSANIKTVLIVIIIIYKNKKMYKTMERKVSCKNTSQHKGNISFRQCI